MYWSIGFMVLYSRRAVSAVAWVAPARLTLSALSSAFFLISAAANFFSSAVNSEHPSTCSMHDASSALPACCLHRLQRWRRVFDLTPADVTVASVGSFISKSLFHSHAPDNLWPALWPELVCARACADMLGWGRRDENLRTGREQSRVPACSSLPCARQRARCVCTRAREARTDKLSQKSPLRTKRNIP